MNEYLKKINNVLKGLIKINPHRHWKILLYIFLIFISILIIFSIYLLYKINNETVFQNKNIENIDRVLLKEALLKKTLNNYEVKVNKETDIKNDKILYIDPSV